MSRRKQTKPLRCHFQKSSTIIPAITEMSTGKRCIKVDPDNVIISKRPHNDDVPAAKFMLVKREVLDSAYLQPCTNKIRIEPREESFTEDQVYFSESREEYSKYSNCPAKIVNDDDSALAQLSAQVGRLSEQSQKGSYDVVRRHNDGKEIVSATPGNKVSTKEDRLSLNLHDSNLQCNSTEFADARISCYSTPSSSSGALSALSLFVERVGASAEVSHSTNLPTVQLPQSLLVKNSDVLRCIICATQCASLDALVQHKRRTGHFRNNLTTIPRIASSQAASETSEFNQVCPMQNAAVSRVSAQVLQRYFEHLLSTMRQTSVAQNRPVANLIGRRGRFGFRCNLCGFTSTNAPVDVHMTSVHSFRSAAEWKEAVVLIPIHK